MSYGGLLLLLLQSWSTCAYDASEWLLVGFYPPVGRVNVLVPDVYPPELVATVRAPWCKTLNTSASEWEVFCRETRPAAANDLPQRPADVLRQVQSGSIDESAGSPLPFAHFLCSTLSGKDWSYRRTAAQVDEMPEGVRYFCTQSTQCYYETTGLPLTRFHSSDSVLALYPTQAQAYAARQRQYYCCTHTQLLQEEGTGAFYIQNVTQCTYTGFRTARAPGLLECSRGDRTRETCTMTLRGQGSDAAVTTLRDYTCDYQCEFPCATPVSLIRPEDCREDRMTGCLPSVYDRQCLRNVVSDTPPYCTHGETAYGYLKNQTVLARAEDGVQYALPLRVECIEGDLGCDIECHCYQAQGCPSHPRCGARGTLYESLGVVQPHCQCYPGYDGAGCEFVLPKVDCNLGQETASVY